MFKTPLIKLASFTFALAVSAQAAVVYYDEPVDETQLPTIYIQAEKGHCCCPTGFDHVTDPQNCAAFGPFSTADRGLGLPDSSPTTNCRDLVDLDPYLLYPPGCFVEDWEGIDALCWNENTGNNNNMAHDIVSKVCMKHCPSNSYVYNNECVCNVGYQDDGAGCQPLLQAHDCRDDQILSTLENACVCPMNLYDDGSTCVSNSENCACGTNECDSSTGLLCRASTSSCSANNLCSVYDSSSANTENCWCGTNVCDSSTGFFCRNDTNTCNQYADCSIDDGSSANTENCGCGSSDCDLSTGLFCVADKNSCSHDVACPIRDGSSANTEDCTCGSIDCDSRTGLICYVSDSGVGTCRQSGIGAYGYVISNTECEVNGALSPQFLVGGEASDCRRAANENPLFSFHSYINSFVLPKGCSVTTSPASANDVKKLRYNYGGLPLDHLPGAYCSILYPCVCYLADDCADGSGRDLNTGICACGTTACTDTSGFFCTSSTNTCSKSAACTNVDGTLVNDDTCKCGSSECYENSGLFCTASTNTCSKYATCTNVDSTLANDDTCNCGLSDCDSSSGLFCRQVTSTCSRAAACTVYDGSSANAVSCVCGSNTCDSRTGLFCNDNRSACTKYPSCPGTNTALGNPYTVFNGHRIERAINY